jgi:hypothetical protein
MQISLYIPNVFEALSGANPCDIKAANGQNLATSYSWLDLNSAELGARIDMKGPDSRYDAATSCELLPTHGH